MDTENKLLFKYESIKNSGTFVVCVLRMCYQELKWQ